MSISFDEWLAELRRSLQEDFGFTAASGEALTPEHRRSWRCYYDEGYGAKAALEEDLFRVVDRRVNQEAS